MKVYHRSAQGQHRLLSTGDFAYTRDQVRQYYTFGVSTGVFAFSLVPEAAEPLAPSLGLIEPLAL